MSKLIYNGIELEFLRTNLYDRSPVMSEDGTEMLYEKHTIDATFLITSDSGGMAAAVADLTIRHKLLEPRKRLEFWNGSTLWLVSPKGGGDADLKNGPTPINCTIRRIDGTSTLVVAYKIETCVDGCGDGSDSLANTAGNPLISNRWVQGHQVSKTKMTTIRTRGVALFRTDRLNAKRTADYFRNRVLPGLPLGFRRAAINITASSDGTSLVYECIDEEALTSLGVYNRDVEDFDASMTIASVRPDGKGPVTGQVVARFSGTALGAPDASRERMRVFLYKLLLERMRVPAGGAANFDTDGMLIQIQTAESLSGREVSLQAEYTFQPRNPIPAGLGALRTDLLGDLVALFANDGKNPPMLDNQSRGKFTGLILTQAIRDACAEVTMPKAIGKYQGGYDQAYLSGPAGTGGGPSSSSSPGDPPIYDPPSVGTDVSDDLPTVLSKYAASQFNGPYTDYRITTQYDDVATVIQVPVAGPPGTPSAILTLGGGMSSAMVSWTAESYGKPPTMPHPDHSDDNYTYMQGQILGENVVVGIDGVTPIYRVSGTYKYALKRPRTAKDDIFLGLVPSLTLEPGQGTISYTSYRHGITDPGEPAYIPGGGPG